MRVCMVVLLALGCDRAGQRKGQTPPDMIPSGGEPISAGPAPAVVPTPASGAAGVASPVEQSPPPAPGAMDPASPVAAGDVPADGPPESTDPMQSQPPAAGLRVIEQLDVAPVWAGHPVTFALVTTQTQQFVAYYDAERRMTVASRTLGETRWQYSPLDSRVGWDSHNYLAMAIDGEGGIHVAGNMHSSPLVYFRSAAPLDISRFESLHRMVGRNETSTTYPQFFIGPTGALVFAYRDGSSGNGNHIFNAYDPGARSWRRLLDTPLTDGEGARNAYPVGPAQGPDGLWHMVWVWRDTPDAATNHDLSYARTRDLITWESGSGQPLHLPVTLRGSDVVDPVPAGGGMINNNTKVGFDTRGRPVIAYHKYDARGNTQLYNARLEDGAWVVYQTSRWDYRWDFGGGGTLVFAIEIEGIVAQADGTLTQTFYHEAYGGWGAFRLNEADLSIAEVIEPPLPYPSELNQVEATTPGLLPHWAYDAGAGPAADTTYLLRWETLPSNRDMPRPVAPPPTMLRVIGVERGVSRP